MHKKEARSESGERDVFCCCRLGRFISLGLFVLLVVCARESHAVEAEAVRFHIVARCSASNEPRLQLRPLAAFDWWLDFGDFGPGSIEIDIVQIRCVGLGPIVIRWTLLLGGDWTGCRLLTSSTSAKLSGCMCLLAESRKSKTPTTTQTPGF